MKQTGKVNNSSEKSLGIYAEHQTLRSDNAIGIGVRDMDVNGHNVSDEVCGLIREHK